MNIFFNNPESWRCC